MGPARVPIFFALRHSAATMATPLDAAEKLALKQFLSKKRATREVRDLTVTKLVAYFGARGQSVLVLPVAPPHGVKAMSAWVDEWKEYAKDAGVDNEPDINNLARWFEEDEHASSGVRTGKAAAVADALLRQGVPVTRDTELAVASALVAAEQGEAAAQHRDVGSVWVIYTGQSPGEEERAWFADQRAAKVVGLGNDDQDPKVDIRMCKTYYKQHSSTSVDTLERALLKDRSGATWARYYQSTIETLQQVGLHHASRRWIEVCGWAKRQYAADLKSELAYLAFYFFERHLGKGMPEVMCMMSALQVAAPTGVQAAASLKLTVPSENDEHQSAMLGPNASYGSHGAGGSGPSSQQQLYEAQQLEMNRLRHELGRWQVWGNQPQGGMQQQYGHQQQQMPVPGMQWAGQQYQQQPPPPQQEEKHCEFCGSDKHTIQDCHKMHKKRAELRKEEKETKAAKAAAEKEG